jgi:hypothetical protein
MFYKFLSATELGEQFLPGITEIDRTTRTNPSPEFLLAHGYKPLIHNPIPPERQFFNIVPLYEDGEDAITNVWQYEEAPKPTYNEYVAFLIHQRYSYDDEIAIIRQKDEKPLEYQAYYDYAELCKIQARTDLGL